VNAALELPPPVGAALLASAEGYTPRANKLIDAGRERLGSLSDAAYALAENLPQPKARPSRSRRRRRRKKKQPAQTEQQPQQEQAGAASQDGKPAPDAKPEPVAAEAKN
jgi:hypothetical protein